MKGTLYTKTIAWLNLPQVRVDLHEEDFDTIQGGNFEGMENLDRVFQVLKFFHFDKDYPQYLDISLLVQLQPKSNSFPVWNLNKYGRIMNL